MLHPGKTALTVLLKDVEIPSSAICFTGDAITSLTNYSVKGAIVNLDEWDWHEELRGGITFYIITNLKKPLQTTL
ncbi:hypothetical protein [Niabella ginsenosidivorans]|nr:hypothetical protein [Niabella ginsenosidivorans]